MCPSISPMSHDDFPTRSMKAPTTLVTAIEVTKAKSGGMKPGVANNLFASGSNTNIKWLGRSLSFKSHHFQWSLSLIPIKIATKMATIMVTIMANPQWKSPISNAIFRNPRPPPERCLLAPASLARLPWSLALMLHQPPFPRASPIRMLTWEDPPPGLPEMILPYTGHGWKEDYLTIATLGLYIILWISGMPCWGVILI